MNGSKTKNKCCNNTPKIIPKTPNEALVIALLLADLANETDTEAAYTLRGADLHVYNSHTLEFQNIILAHLTKKIGKTLFGNLMRVVCPADSNDNTDIDANHKL